MTPPTGREIGGILQGDDSGRAHPDDTLGEDETYELAVTGNDGQSIRDHLATLIEICERWRITDDVDDGPAVKNARTALFEHLSRLADPEFSRPAVEAKLVRISIKLPREELGLYPWERLQLAGDAEPVATIERSMISRTVGHVDAASERFEIATAGVERFFPEYESKNDPDAATAPASTEATRALVMREDPQLEDLPLLKKRKEAVRYRRWVDGTPAPWPAYVILNPSFRRSKDEATILKERGGDTKPLQAFLDYVRRTPGGVRPRLIVIETFAKDPTFDSERNTARLAHALAEMGVADVAFVCHPRSSTYPNSDGLTFTAKLIDGIEEGRTTSAAFYQAWRWILDNSDNTERDFGVPGLYIIERSSEGEEAREASGVEAPHRSSLSSSVPLPRKPQDGASGRQGSSPPSTPPKTKPKTGTSGFDERTDRTTPGPQ